jgi:DNA-binding transcriptional regulator YiaG
MTMTPNEVVKLRKALGLTQTELAARMGTTATTVYRWETGRARVTAPMALLLKTLKKK